MLERRGVEQRLERRPRLSAAAACTVELRFAEVPAADQGEDVAAGGVDGDERRLEPGIAEAPQALANRPLRHFLQLRHERRPDAPVRRMIPAEAIPEGLPQELLRVAGARLRRFRIRAHPDARAARGLLLSGGDETLFAHALQHHVAPGDCVVEVVPGGQRGRCAGQAGDQRRLRQRQLPGRFAEQVPGHRLDAVNAGAEVDAIQVQLEDLILRQLCVDHHRQHRFVQLAGVGLAVGQEQRPGELLRQRRAPLERSWIAHVPDHRPREPDRIDPDVAVEPMVFYRDEGVLQVRRDVGQRHVLPLLIHPEPFLAVRGEEPCVADAARQPVDGVALTHGPRHGDGRRNRQHDEDGGRDPVADPPRPERHGRPAAAARRRCRTSDRTV